MDARRELTPFDREYPYILDRLIELAEEHGPPFDDLESRAICLKKELAAVCRHFDSCGFDTDEQRELHKYQYLHVRYVRHDISILIEEVREERSRRIKQDNNCDWPYQNSIIKTPSRIILNSYVTPAPNLILPRYSAPTHDDRNLVPCFADTQANTDLVPCFADMLKRHQDMCGEKIQQKIKANFDLASIVRTTPTPDTFQLLTGTTKKQAKRKARKYGGPEE